MQLDAGYRIDYLVENCVNRRIEGSRQTAAVAYCAVSVLKLSARVGLLINLTWFI